MAGNDKAVIPAAEPFPIAQISALEADTRKYAADLQNAASGERKVLQALPTGSRCARTCRPSKRRSPGCNPSASLISVLPIPPPILLPRSATGSPTRSDSAPTRPVCERDHRPGWSQYPGGDGPRRRAIWLTPVSSPLAGRAHHQRDGDSKRGRADLRSDRRLPRGIGNRLSPFRPSLR